MVIHCTEKFYNAERKYQDYFDLFPYPLSDFQNGQFMRFQTVIIV